MLRKSVVFLVLLLSSWAPQIYALGLGNVSVESALNQPLRLRIEILQLGDTRLQDITVQMASVADFQRFNIDRVSFLSEIRFAIAAEADGNFITLSSNQIVREPYLSFILDTRWPNGRLLSEHTVLLDLPVFNEQQSPSTPVRQPISPVLRAPAGAAPAPVAAPAVTVPELEPVAPEPASVEPEETPEPAPPMPESEPEPAVDAAVESPAPVAAAPAPAAIVASPEPVATAPATLQTAANETLTEIALRVRPDNSVTMQQTMLAIQRLNPGAFIDGNINRMRAGQVLRVPGLSEIQSVDARQAADEVSRQNRDFAATDVQPLAAPASTSQTPAATPQGQLTVVTADEPIDANAAESSLAAAENAALDERIAALELQLAQQQEEADRARLQREEMQARMTELETQVAAAQEIIRLQDLQLAQLQDSLAQAAAQQAAIAAAEAELAATARANRPSLMDTVMGVLTSTTFFIVIGALVLILALVVLLLRRNRAKDEESDLEALEDNTFGADDDETAANGEYLDFEDDDLDDIIGKDVGEGNVLGRAGALLRQGKVGEAVSLLLVAVEDEPDDAELRLKLLEALARQGDAASFEEHVSQLDADTAAGSRVADLRKQLTAAASTKPGLGGRFSSEEDDERGAASFLDDLGIDLDAFNDDDDEEPPATRAPTQVAAEAEPEFAAELDAEPETEAAAPVADSDEMDLSFDLSPDEDSDTLEFDDGEGAEIIGRTHTEAAAGDEDSHTLEFEVGDFGDTAPATADKAEAAADDFDSFEFSVDDSAPAKAPAAEPALDLETFDFDSDDLTDDTVPARSAEAAPATAAADSDDNALDFDFDKTAIKAPEPESATDLATDLETFDFDLDTDPSATVVEKPAGKVELDLDTDDFDVGEKTVIETDDGDIMLDFDLDEDDTTAKGEGDAPAPTPTVDDLDDGDLDDLDFLSDDDDIDVEEVSLLSNDDEVATKLELAYAYRKMGDKDGAREILEEVLKEGSEAQVKEANELIASLADND